MMPPPASLVALVYWGYLGCLVYLVGATLLYLSLALVAGVQALIRNREERAEDFDVIAASRFTIPVSVIAPAYNEEVIILAAVRSLLELEYPEHEVVVVNDGSTDRTLDLLKEEFELEPRQVFFRRVLPCREIRSIYRSKKEPRLVVVDKENVGKADAMNCGVNLSRYRYVCCVDADTFYAPDALLKTMRLAQKDPARVIGITSPVAVGSQPEARLMNGSGQMVIDRRPLVDFQYLDFLRSFLNNRLAWSRLKIMLCVACVFSVWRRDVVQELGGFSPDFTCEDLEFTFRVHRHFLHSKKPYQVLCMPDIVGASEGPTRVGPLISQRARWQRTILEAIWAYRRLFANPRYGAVGLLGMPYYVFYEGLAPFMEFLSLLVVGLAWWLGVIGWPGFFLFLGAQVFANGILTNAGVLLQDIGSRSYSLSSLGELVLLGSIEFLVYRPLILLARWQGIIEFVRGDKSWYKFERNSRERGVKRRA